MNNDPHTSPDRGRYRCRAVEDHRRPHCSQRSAWVATAEQSMTPESIALGRAIYEQSNRTGLPWRELSRLECDLWIARANELINNLDVLGYRLAFIPPEG